MLKLYFHSVIAATVLSTTAAVFSATATIGPTTTTAPATLSSAPRHINAHYATPTAVIKTLALAIKAGDSQSIRECIEVKGSAHRAAVAAFAHISAAGERFTKEIAAKLGPPPKGLAVTFGSIDKSMNRLLALLPKAVISIHHSAQKTSAIVTFPASSTGKSQIFFVCRHAGAWKVNGAKLLHLDQPGLAGKTVRRRAKQINLLAVALDQTTRDIQTGKVKTWTALEKKMELHILEAQAAMEASRNAPAAPPAMAASPAHVEK